MALVMLPHAAASAAEARRRLVEDLRARGLDSEVIADAELVLTELVGNAVRHARPLPGGQLRTGWSVEELRVTLRVIDGGAATSPTLQRQSDQGGSERERGRGLAIIAALASSWGAQQQGATLETWAVLDLTHPA